MTNSSEPRTREHGERRRSPRRRSDVSAQHILERITDEFSALDPEWRFTYVNQAALHALRRALGERLTKDEVLGKNVWRLLPAHVGSDLYVQYHTAMRTQATVRFETRSSVTGRWIGAHLYPSHEGLSVYTRDITERKHVEARLVYHAYLLDHLYDAVIATDERLTVTAWNKGATQMYGWRAEEALGRNVWEVIGSALTSDEQVEAVRELETRGQFRTESLTHRKDGVPVAVEGITIALRGDQEDGPITGYVTIRRDITERWRAEAVRRQTHERLELVLESITDRFCTIDRQWRYTYFNRHAKEQLRAFGTDPDTLVGTVLWQAFPSPASEPALRRAMRDRVVTRDEQFFPPLGEWYEHRIYPSPDGGLAVFQTDVTAKKRAEEQLRRSEAYLTEGQRLTHTGSWALDVSTRALFWSEEHFRICGLDPAHDTPSYATLHWIHPDDRTRVQETFEEALRDRTDYELDCRVLWRDGTIRSVHSFAHPVFNASGDLTEYVGTILDTTERQHGEEARNELVRRLFAAQEDERRRLSHELHDDFGQQVSALRWQLGALRREHGREGNTQLGAQLASLEASVTQLEANVDLIAWQLRPAALDDLGLDVAVTTYVQGWSAHFDVDAGVHVSGTAPSGSTREGDIALYRIMQEALNNVAKHAQARRVSVLLQRSAHQVSLIVEDDGIGFESGRVFTAGGGKHLGLIGMRERAVFLGGSLDVESQVGQGTTVVARLPV